MVLVLLGVSLKNAQINKICHLANRPYVCKGLNLINHMGCGFENASDEWDVDDWSDGGAGDDAD